MMTVSIKRYEEKFSLNNLVTYYFVEVYDHTSKNGWTVSRRYSDFKTLYDTLKKTIPDLPKMPSVTLFKVKSIEDLEKRKKGLETFLKECVDKNYIFNSQIFMDFLEINKHSKNIESKEADLYYQYSKLPLGIRDFKINEKKQVLFVCCSDMNIVSRADSMLFNINIFNKKTSNNCPLGALFVYQFEEDSEAKYIVHKIWAKTFNVQTGCLFYDEESDKFGVGLDDGKIYIYKDNKKSHYVKSDLYNSLENIHTNRVTGLAYDNSKQSLYSCGNDNCVYAIEIKNDGNIGKNLLRRGFSPYSGLFFDKLNSRLIVCSELGELSIFTTSCCIPDLIINIQTSSTKLLKALAFSDYYNYIFTGAFDGKITVTNLGMKGKEKLISEISSFGSISMKIRVCCFIQKKFELLTGDDAGKVAAWDLKKGTVIKLWTAHTKAITQMFFDDNKNLLFTGSKDKLLKVWVIPEQWTNKECEYANHYVTAITYNENSDESSFDSLDGWDIRE